MLIESDKRGVELQLLYADEKFAVPENVYIIGMMNTADRSLATSGFRYQTFTDDPQVRKVVDDEIYNLFGEKNPRALEEYENPPAQGINFGGM